MMFEWLRNLFRPKGQRLSRQYNPADWFVNYVRGGLENDAGVEVSGFTILSYAPMYYAVTRIAGNLGQLPLNLKKLDKQTGSCEIIRAGQQPPRVVNPYILNVEPVVPARASLSMMSSMDLKETITSNAIVWGNGRCWIERDTAGMPIGLIPMDPARTWTSLEYVDGMLVDKIHTYSTYGGAYAHVADRDVLHIKGLGPDAYIGYSLIELARNSVGGGLATERHSNRMMRNNAMPGVILEVPENALMDDQEAQQYLNDFNKYHAGLDKAGRAGMLRNGVKANKLSMSAEDAQFVEQRRFQREEAALWTQIETMLGIDNSIAYNSLQARNQAYIQNCLSRWLNKWACECTIKLLTAEQRRLGYFFEFDPLPLLRGTMEEFVGVLREGREIGLWSQEETREMAGLGPIDPTHNFANPNTTPGDGREQPPAEESAEESEESEDESEPQDASLTDIFGEWMIDEIGTIRSFTSDSGAFLNHITRYYDRRQYWLETKLARLELPLEIASQWIVDSRDDVLTAAEVQPDELAESVYAITSSWRERAQAYLDNGSCHAIRP